MGYYKKSVLNFHKTLLLLPVEYHYHITIHYVKFQTYLWRNSREKPRLNTVSVQKMYNGENGIHKYMCTLSTHFAEITLHTLLKYFDCNNLHRCFFQ